MTYSHLGNTHRSSKKSWLGVSIFLVTIIILCGLLFLFRTSVRDMYRRLWGARTEYAVINGEAFSTKRGLINKNTELNNRIAELESVQAELKILQDENTSLRSLVRYSSHPDQMITAQILTKPSQELFDRMIIDAGSEQGIVVGNQVVVGDGILLGTVAEVGNRTSLVELYSSPNLVLDFVIKSLGITIPGSGKGSGNFEFKVPRDVTVADGDVIVKSGDPSRALGIVKSVTFDPRDPFQTVLARTPVNVEELKFVQIIR